LIEAPQSDRLRVVLCWNMHQPQYRDLVQGEPLRPWAYLRGIKDYVDMAVHLEAVPDACAVVNFSPVLLEQLDDYASQLAAHLRSGAPVRDPVLALLTPDGVPADRSRWPDLVRSCLRAHPEHMIGRFPRYRELAGAFRRMLDSGSLADAAPESFADLAAWFHLAWFGETVRRGDPRVRALLEREGHFTPAHLRLLLECVADTLAGLIPRYRRLAGSGKIELAVAPWGHPILPLMFDFSAAREADPDIELPASASYPGGADRARWHVARAIQAFSRTFGVRPRGCWPPEGAISTATIELLESFGFDWLASGESVLQRSLTGAAGSRPSLAESCGAYRVPGRQTACFFRNDELSDLIGFSYARMDGEEAAADFVRRLEAMASGNPDNSGRVVAVIIEGDAAWEYFPDNAHDFLRPLYERLTGHPRLRLTTFARCLQEGVEIRQLDPLVAGSWIQGSLATWIGSPSRNHAWDLLCEAKRVFDQVVVEGGLDEAGQRAAELQLGACEASDWFWWLADYNPEDTVGGFDELYRRHLANLYRLLGEHVPAHLHGPIAHGGGSPPLGGAMLPAAGPGGHQDRDG